MSTACTYRYDVFHVCEKCGFSVKVIDARQLIARINSHCKYSHNGEKVPFSEMVDGNQLAMAGKMSKTLEKAGKEDIKSIIANRDNFSSLEKHGLV